MNASDPQALLRVGNREPHGGQSDMFTQVLNSVDQACRKRALIAAGCPLEIPLNHHHFVEFNLDADPAMAAVCRSQQGKCPAWVSWEIQGPSLQSRAGQLEGARPEQSAQLTGPCSSANAWVTGDPPGAQQLARAP